MAVNSLYPCGSDACNKVECFSIGCLQLNAITYLANVCVSCEAP